MQSSISQGKCTQVQQPTIGARRNSFSQTNPPTSSAPQNSQLLRIDFNKLSAELLAVTGLNPN